MSRSNPEQRQTAAEDLLPWADPYIASLMEKLHRCGGRLLHREDFADNPIKSEASPPLGTEDPNADSVYFGDDWSARGAWHPE